MTRFDAVGFGALNVDKLFKVNCVVGPDCEGFVTGFEEACGGSAANTMAGLARLGCRTGFIGKVADDKEGQLLTRHFQEEGVDANGIVTVKAGRSGTVMGFIDGKGNRALFVDPGVNDTIMPEEIKKEYVRQTEFLHLASFVGQNSFQTQTKLVEALPRNVKVSFDPGEIYAGKGLKALEPILNRTYVFMPSARELQMLGGKADYKENAEFMIGKGVRIVAVKMGNKGCYVTDGKESHRIEAFKVKVVDTTGAGDAFCAGFLYGLLKKKNLAECGKIGNFVASRCVMKMGARTGLPKLEDLVEHKLD
jgi:ribokinase